jgi:hypothetical protein
MPRAIGESDAVAAVIRVAFAAQAVVTDPLPPVLGVTAADVAARRGRRSGAEPGGGLAGSVLWNAQDSGISLFLTHPGFHTHP